VTSPAVVDDVVGGMASVPGCGRRKGTRPAHHVRRWPIVVEGIDRAARGPSRTDGDWAAIAASFWAGEGVVVNEKLAHRRGVRRGDVVRLTTPSANGPFRSSAWCRISRTGTSAGSA